MRRSRGGVRSPPPPPPPPQKKKKNHKNMGFLSNIGLDPLKITKLPSQHSMLGDYAIGTPAKHDLNGVLLFGQ